MYLYVPLTQVVLEWLFEHAHEPDELEEVVLAADITSLAPKITCSKKIDACENTAEGNWSA